MSADELRLQRRAAPDDYELFREHIEEFNTSALHRKLVSKMEALRILRKELEQFRTERDQFKLMAETLQLRYSALTRRSDLTGCGLDGGKSSVATLLHETRERNIKLTTEVESLKQKLNELHGDIELLRAGKEYRPERVCSAESEEPESGETSQWKLERANFICHLENLKKKNVQLAFDLKAVIDEKEELITERDAYKCKAHRLNHELFNALKANEAHPKFLDIDGVLLENKYLHERLKSLENELDLNKQSMNKYKTMLETKRKKGIIKLGTNSNDESILSHKQVKNILESGIDLPTKTETIQDLKSLCLALLDNLNDKNLALNHQKKTNKILATKIAELEARIQSLAGIDTGATTTASSCNSSYSPSQLLLQGYCASSVDSSNTIETASTITATSSHSDTIEKCATGCCLVNEDSGTMSSESEDANKTLRAISDDSVDSSTESSRSILSSEYGGTMEAMGACSLSDFASAAMQAYKTPPSTTTDSGGNSILRMQSSTPRISSAVERERQNDLKDLPPELAAMVQQALHELDMRDFDEVVSAAACDEHTYAQPDSVKHILNANEHEVKGNGMHTAATDI